MTAATVSLARRNRISAGYAFALVGGMTALGFASVPLYRIFCQVTGYGGTTQVASAATAARVKSIDAPISIRFDANTSSALPWTFRPEHPTDTVALGARDMAIFIASNKSDKPVTGTAAYNVTPEAAGKYFTKIQCFCFTQQTLKPGETVRMPVLFFVDPAIKDDPDARDIQQITLSYTFYPVDPDKKQS